jgi:ADP-ribose pyrophosphatase YjhB (NUDIX family)
MPTFGVNVAIIQDGQVLLTQRRDFPVWCLPGGGVEDGESNVKRQTSNVKREM